VTDRTITDATHISLVGVLTGLQGEVSTVALLAKQARLQGLMVGSRRQQQDYVAASEKSGVRPVLDSTFPLDQLADAFSYQASGVHFGKVAVEW
jgi:D-arabinose 1-dehydrogenase-like Zn-dependent alcohol dehydrogenase